MVNPALLTSNNQNYETPPAFFERINKSYRFTLDACANAENTKCEKYFSVADDGLKQSWAGESVWINPPYAPTMRACLRGCQRKTCAKRGYHIKEDQPGQIAWVKKAWEEVQHNNCNVAVLLLPARTDTRLFHEYVLRSSLVVFIRGRLQFVDAPQTAVFPSMLVSFESWQRHTINPFPKFTTMNAEYPRPHV